MATTRKETGEEQRVRLLPFRDLRRAARLLERKEAHNRAWERRQTAPQRKARRKLRKQQERRRRQVPVTPRSG